MQLNTKIESPTLNFVHRTQPAFPYLPHLASVCDIFYVYLINRRG